MLDIPTIFKWHQSEPALILCAVRWYLRYSLSLRNIEELLEERGLGRITRRSGAGFSVTARVGAAHAASSQTDTGAYSLSRPRNRSWRVDETYIRVKGRWCYLYCAIDSAGARIDFLSSAVRDADTAKRLFRGALSDRSHPQPRIINTDLAAIYISAISDIKKHGTFGRRCRHRPVQYLTTSWSRITEP
jgi:transposase-like protein